MPDHRFPDGEEFTSYPLDELLTPLPPLRPPDDFAEFWRETYVELTAPAGEVRIERDCSAGGRSIELISFRSSSGGRVLGWLVGPGDRQPVRRGLVISHGYGGRELPDPLQVADNAAAIFPVAPWLPINAGGLPGSEHVLIGIGDRYRYAHRFSAADIWRAATILLQRYPDAAACLDYRGGSFGGGIGALALPWDDRFRRATLHVPSFGYFPIRLSRRCTGSGEAVRQHLLGHPEHRPMLDYFDSTLAAAEISIDVQVSAARTDPAVDPRGQFAVYHALAGTKRLVVCTAGHAEFPGEAEQNLAVESAARRFLAADDVDELPPIIEL
ncbi:acetylxylan esterase [Microlunatus soli]|uniref:Cephalosporin-C deacetylase n=1 Tax=Microlunatus soli TaxID=630515 RepID=A0A1H1VA33_9ACTN|nr:acetylxylan esterase [Microlunatus soli]SDS81614.1 cephalosporin-C deacetylase [Microlunatus soli]